MHRVASHFARSYLREFMLHGDELRAELLLVQVVETGDLFETDRRVQLEVRSDLREQDLLPHLLHEDLCLTKGRSSREFNRKKKKEGP